MSAGAPEVGHAQRVERRRRRVLVTGGARGIGRAIVLAFAAEGDRVALHHRSSPSEARAVLASASGDGHVVVRGDLAVAEEARSVVDAAAERLGGLDVVVNNAGVYIHHPPGESGWEQWKEAWRRTIDLNLLGPAHVTFAALAHLGPGGRIVNVSSRGAFRGEPDAPAYGASKAGLNALGQSLARALGERSIAVTTVAPGFVETAMSRERLESPRGAAARAESPFGRVAQPREVAAAVLWLASGEAEWASGAVLDLNGASYLRT